MTTVKDFFTGGIGQKEIMTYLTTQNFATQAFAVDAVNAENVQTTGTAACMINGVYIPVLTADAELDISADTTGNAAGVSITDGSEQYFVALAATDGTLSLWTAGVEATTGSAVLKIPAFDPTLYVCVGILLLDASGAAFVVGTSSTASRSTFYQVIGPVFPHPDNLSQALGV